MVPLGVLIPLAELGGALLFVAVPGGSRPGGALLLALLAVFTAVVCLSLARGRSHIPCACFGRSSRPLSWGIPFRNIVMAIAVGSVLVTPVADNSAVTVGGLVGGLIGAACVWVISEAMASAARGIWRPV